MNFGFLGQALTWLTTHAEGMKAGTRTAQQIESSPIVEAAVQIGEQAVKGALEAHLGQALGIPPTAAGVTGLLTGLIDKAPELPAATKEPLKLYLGGLLGGTDFFVSSTPAANTAALPPSGQAENQQ